MTLLYREVADAVARADKPLILSGDCTTALGVVTGLQRHRDLAVVWLDGHGDFNTPDTTITGYLGGMPLAMLAGRAGQLIGDRLGLRPVADSSIVLADARDLDPAERDALAASQFRRVPASPAAITAALTRLGPTTGRNGPGLHTSSTANPSQSADVRSGPPKPAAVAVLRCCTSTRSKDASTRPADPEPRIVVAIPDEGVARRRPDSELALALPLHSATGKTLVGTPSSGCWPSI
jgi:Arginase family